MPPAPANAVHPVEKTSRISGSATAKWAAALESGSVALGKMAGRLAHEGVSVMKAIRAAKARLATLSPTAQADEVMMPKPKDKVTIEERERWMLRSAQHQARIKIDPARAMPSGDHLDAAVLEEWLDGLVSDEYIERYMRDHRNQCRQCQDVYEHYRTVKETSHE
jgi:hypothetical protein